MEIKTVSDGWVVDLNRLPVRPPIAWNCTGSAGITWIESDWRTAERYWWNTPYDVTRTFDMPVLSGRSLCKTQYAGALPATGS